MPKLHARAKRPLALLLAALTVLLAALLIWQCIDVYREGTAASNLTGAGVRIHDIFSREIVAERFWRIRWAVWAWLMALAASAAERVMKPEAREFESDIPPEYRLKRIKARVELTQAMKNEERKRRVAWGIAAASCAAGAAFAGAYLLDGESFASRDLEAVMAEMLARVAPWVTAAFAALMLAAEYAHRSALREIEAAKKAPERARAAQSREGKSPVTAVQVALGLAALALIALGIVNGGMWDVLVKAINICTECVGLG